MVADLHSGLVLAAIVAQVLLSAGGITVVVVRALRRELAVVRVRS